MIHEKEILELSNEALSAVTGGKGPETVGEGASPEAELEVIVKVFTREQFTIKVKLSDYIRQVKDKIAAKSSLKGYKNEDTRIYYGGNALYDNWTVGECNISNQGMLYLKIINMRLSFS
jgi:hypothetical protein